MVGYFKQFIVPSVGGSRKNGLIHRKCRKNHNNNAKISSSSAAAPAFFRLSSNKPRSHPPRFRKRYVVLVTILIIICTVIGLAYNFGFFSSNKNEENHTLVPPNPTKPLPPSQSTLHTFRKAAVCADGPPCAEIGKSILEKNGSAVDATLAAMFCNGMATMQSMGLGGGFLMTIYIRNESRAYTLNAREKAPSGAKEEMFKNDPSSSQNGPLSIAVPGELRGYWMAHQRFGKLKWEEIIQPTVDLCKKGYVMTYHQYHSLEIATLHNDSNFQEWFYDENGEFRKPGSTIVPRKLCTTLETIARNGGNDLYNGTLAKLFLEDLNQLGSIITKDDLENYTAEWMSPIEVSLRNGEKLFSVPPPGSGILLAFILNILDGFKFSPQSISDTETTVNTYHKIIEAFKHAYAKRTELGDMDFVNLTSLIQNLTSNEYAAEIREKIKENSTSQNPADYGAVFINKDDHGTAHISVLAENGDAVSVTSSINIYFGAGFTSPQTGIIPNSVMDDFSVPFFKNFFGLPGSPNNVIRPGKRPLSSMAPSILVDEKGDVKLVVGASGGTKITTAVALVIIRTLWFRQNIKEAVDAPRFHHQLFPMQVNYGYGMLQQYVDGLEAIGHKTNRSMKSTSIICALWKELDKIYANADYRKGGDVYGIN